MLLDQHQASSFPALTLACIGMPTWRTNRTVKMAVHKDCWYSLMSLGCDCQDDVGEVLVDVGQLQS